MVNNFIEDPVMSILGLVIVPIIRGSHLHLL